MAIAAYVPIEVRFADREIEGARLVTIHDPAAEHRNGSMTTPNPLEAGVRGGPLVFVGRREGKEFEVRLPEIRVRGKSAIGFEFDILGPIEEKVLREGVPDNRSAIQKGLGDLGATF